MAENPNELMKPDGAAPSASEPVIHVIPEKFYGAALKKKIAKEPPKQNIASDIGVAGTTPPPPAMPKPASAAGSAKKGKAGLVIALVVLLLVVGGGAAYFFLGKKPTAVQNTPVAVVNTNMPAGPVCGDAQCDSPSETYENCKADCPAPPPRCGDKQCDADTESYGTCPEDCPPPAPVCGNNKCEAPSETADSCPDDCQTVKVTTPGLDTDGDGLTDEEERSLYGTNPNDPNTDKDSFVDNNEVLNLFDPAKPSPAMLKDSIGIAVYTNPAQHYQIYRPAAWTVKEEDDAKRTVYFNAASGESIEVLIEDKADGQSLLQWYNQKMPGVNPSQIIQYNTRQGYNAIISQDQSMHYVDLGDRVAIVSYSTGTRAELQYKVTFQMMVQSLLRM